MRVVSEAFKQAMQSPMKTLRAHMSIAGSDQVIRSSDTLISVKIEAVGHLFGAATTRATISLIGTDYDLIGKDVTVQLEVMDGAQWHGLEVLRARVMEQSVHIEKGTTTLQCLDAVGVMAKTPYQAGEVVFPCTIAELGRAVAGKFGLEVQGLEALPNAEYQIAEDPYVKMHNVTCRDVLAEIAGATASLARLEGSALVWMRPPQETTYALTYDNIIKATFQPVYGPVNAVVLSRVPQEDNIAVRDEESIATHGLTEVKLANNELLDDDRQLLAQPILDALAGYTAHPGSITTEGHGWYMVGDRVRVTEGEMVRELVIERMVLEIGQGIKETLYMAVPTQQQTDYARAGGIMKTIYNTEIKVDKQKQEIESVVSRQQSLDDDVREQFTSIRQDLGTITSTVQTTGGSNLIKNSVGYARDGKGKLSEWQYGATGEVAARTSPASIAAGALSGNEILVRAGGSIWQRVAVQDAADATYSLGVIARKGALGTAKISVKNGGVRHNITLAHGTAYEWTQYSIEHIRPSAGHIDIVIETDAAVEDFAVTDLMLNIGERAMKWVQASGEILNTQVSLNHDGIVVRSSVYDGDYTVITPLEFAGYSSASGTSQRVFSLNRDVTKVQNLEASAQITMPPIKVVPIQSGVRAGWSFVKTGGGA